jgi:cysteinyl-tRNA synthetase
VLDLGAQSLATARQSLERLDDFMVRLAEGRSAGEGDPRVKAGIAEATNRFHECLDDDLNTAGALGALFEMVRDMNTSLDRQVAGSDEIGAALALLSDFETIFGIPLGRASQELTAEEAALVEAREEARRSRDYAEADRIRDVLLERGIVLEDTPSGTRWKRGPAG